MLLLLLLVVASVGAREVNNTDVSDIPAGGEISDTSGGVTKDPDEYILDPITVEGRRIRTTEKAVTTTQVTMEDIEFRSDKVLKDVLYQVPSIQVSTQRKGTTRFSMRGYDMSNVAILIDGIPIIDSFGGSLDIDNIGLMDISEVVVSRGVSSALYGTKGAVGSINLIKRAPTEAYVNASVEFGEHGNIVAGFSHGAAVGQAYYYLSAIYDRLEGYNVSDKLDRKTRENWLLKLSRYDLYRYSLDNIYDNPGSSAATYYLNDIGLWDHTRHEKYKISGKFGYHLTPGLEVGASMFYNDTEKESSNYFTDMRSMYTYNDYLERKAWRLPDASYILRNISSLWPEYDDYAVSPFVDYRNGKFRLKANAYLYKQTNTFLAYDDPMEHDLAYNRDAITMTWSIWDSSTYGFNLYPSYEWSPRHQMNFALSYYVSDHTEEEQAYNEESTKIINYYGMAPYEILNIEAAYLTLAVEDEIKIGEDLELSVGVSYDGQDLRRYQKKRDIYGSTDMVEQYQAMDDAMIWGTRDSFNPVADIVYEPIKDFLKLRAAVSRKTSFPTLRAYSRTLSPYQDSSDFGSADVKIKPEKMLNGNVGIAFSFLDERLVWGTDYFYSKYDDKITRIYITKGDDYIYRNMDAAVIHGLETTLSWRIPNVMDVADVDFSSTYTYIHSENQSDVDDSFINKGEQFENLPEHKFTFDIRTHFKTDTSLIVFGNFEFNQIQYAMNAVPTTADGFSTSYFHAEPLHDPCRIDVKLLQKLFLKYDYEIYIMCKNILDDYRADPFNPGPGRSWYLGFKASF